MEKCLAYGLPKPQYQQDEDFRVVIYRPESQEITSGTQSGTQSGTRLGTMSNLSLDILDLCRSPKTINEIMALFGYSDRTKYRHAYMAPLFDVGVLEMTIPDKPTSSQHKYRITGKGIQFLNRKNDTDGK